MEKGKENKKNKNGLKSKGKEYELSEEAEIGPDQKKHIKELEEGRAIVSKEPKFSPEEDTVKTEETESSAEREIPEKTQSKESKTKVKESTTTKKENKEQGKENKRKKEIKKTTESLSLNTRKLVNLLASYGVPLDEPVRKLIHEIKKKGNSHLKRELKE